MYKYFLGILLLSISYQSFALEVQMSHAVFKKENNSSYAELYFWIPAWELEAIKKEDSLYHCGISLLILLKNESNEVVYDKFRLYTLPQTNKNNFNFSFLDIKRYALPPGKYSVSITAQDAISDTSETYVYSFDDINIPQTFQNKVQFSSIALLDTFYTSNATNPFVKNGIHMMPLVTDFYNTGSNVLRYYTELYTDSLPYKPDDKLLIKTMLLDTDGKELETVAIIRKVAIAPVVPILQNLSIAKLPTGNYYLQVEAIDKNNNLLAKKLTFFQRMNLELIDTISIETFNTATDFGKGYFDTASLDYLHYTVMSLVPIAPYGDITYINELGKAKDPAIIKQFIATFWKKANPLSPEYAWKKYEEQVRYAERNYSTTIEHGFQTDRGRVYLKYGAPNNIVRNKESASYEYEIWHYYSLANGQNNIRFVFYNPSMVNNAMQLLHSEARGEINDPQWKLKIYGTTGGRDTIDPDNTNYTRGTGSQLNRMIDDF